ncbi:uracil-DNA glycosylase [Aliiroseovarius subalbicans]|uniref:uracil-DNA glycosylase n=1 Tax=Aliiroseovarius subalbicans TaxID=2925840 RepID=UPI001F568B6B|nr:uracil-DNA glycosylase [Aliiroseovarius subalbicans]MCI2399583.1 uracil-DNA glycosylase [Aliiroseovarius subalbicans]
MESALEWHTARALLEWQVEMGATEAIGDAPVDRYAMDPAPAKPKPAPAVAAATPAQAPVRSVRPAAPSIDHVALAKQMASGAQDLDGLRAALNAFEGCELKKGARNTVFADGNPAARVMIIGEAPGRDEDIEGKPFVGRAGQLLDKMCDAIGMGRAAPLSKDAVYITNVLPWRPPQNRDPKPEEVAMLLPFLTRHVELVAPDVLVLMGNHACQAVLGKRGITRLRGQWGEALGRPALPMFHPAYLLRNPAAKREAWADLLSLQAKLRELA